MNPIPLVDLPPPTPRSPTRSEPASTACSPTDGVHRRAGRGRLRAGVRRLLGVAHCVGVGNGTDALELALRAVGVGPGDEVIVPANTFVATAEAVVARRCRPVLVDCDDDLLIDPTPVAGGGHRADPRRRPGRTSTASWRRSSASAARRRGRDVPVVEDAAQSQGATPARPAGRVLADVAATSFYPGKNLGAVGDAGAVTDRRRRVADPVRRCATTAGREVRARPVVGTNSRLDAIQAVVLRAKLRRLDGVERQRAAAAAARTTNCSPTSPGVLLPGRRRATSTSGTSTSSGSRSATGCSPSWHARRRSAPGIHYPAPVHLLPAFAHLGLGPGSFPVAERAATEILSLPMYPQITADQQSFIAETLAKALSRI